MKPLDTNLILQKAWFEEPTFNTEQIEKMNDDGDLMPSQYASMKTLAKTWEPNYIPTSGSDYEKVLKKFNEALEKKTPPYESIEEIQQLAIDAINNTNIKIDC